MSTSYDATQGVPVPPQILNVAPSTVVGSGISGTDVTLTVVTTDGITHNFPPQAVYSSGTWYFDVSSLEMTGATVLATASYKGGQQSDAFVRVAGQSVQAAPQVALVTASSVAGTASVPQQKILAWKGSDGSKVVDYAMQSSFSESFQAFYLPGVTLNAGDLLYVVSAYPGNGSMSPYDIKPEGYQGPAS